MRNRFNGIGIMEFFSLSMVFLSIFSLFSFDVFAADGVGSSEPIVDSANPSSVSTPLFFFDNFAMYLIIIFGIFSFVAYLVVTYIVYKGQGFFGPWIFFSVIALLFLFSEFTLNNIVIHRRFVAGIMFLFFAAAVFRYWDAVEKGQ